MRLNRMLAMCGAVAMTTALLAGCASSDGLAAGYGSGQGYVSGDGAYLEIPAADRAEQIVFGGATTHGTVLDSAELLGEVTVVNFWYAGCPPCRIEAPELARLQAELDDVNFVGVNTYDTIEVAQAFEREFGIEYPSILDVADGAVQLAFAGSVAPNAVPTTIILDPEGRVAGRISGIIRDPKILVEMIETVQADS